MHIRPSELRVVECAAKGMTIKETADKLKITSFTVSVYRYHAVKRNGLASMTQLVYILSKMEMI